jgi:hypothetical protein
LAWRSGGIGRAAIGFCPLRAPADFPADGKMVRLYGTDHDGAADGFSLRRSQSRRFLAAWLDLDRFDYLLGVVYLPRW